MFRKVLLSLILVFAVASFAHAQAPKGNLPQHQTTLTWTNGVDPTGTTLTGSNVYKCSGSCTSTTGTFTSITPTPLGAAVTTLTDTAVASLQVNSYCVTNLVTIPTGPFETACSNIVVATTPKDVAVSPVLQPPSAQ